MVLSTALGPQIFGTLMDMGIEFQSILINPYWTWTYYSQCTKD